jgi:hypothetical protein
LFPALPGIEDYKRTLRRITKTSNEFLLEVVEDLTFVFSEGRETKWRSDIVEEHRDGFLNELLAERDSFIYRNETIILSTLEEDKGLTIIPEVESVATTA